MWQRFRRHAGAFASIAAGLVLFVSGTGAIANHQPTNAPVAALTMMLAGLACYSAIARKLRPSANALVRIGLEFVAVGLILFLWLGQNNLKLLVATDPVPEFIVPVWALLAYVVDFFRKPKPLAALSS